MKKKNVYYEPGDYFPKEIRKKFGLGEFNTDEYGKTPEKKTTKKTGTKKKTK
ncbi:MAG: hypothetical protein KBS75_09305 [Bacteroidales bacterium]|nr:hypothetical protein [Candidatus Equimonas faecalis]